MTVIEVILGGMVVSTVTAACTAAFSNKSKVTVDQCHERQKSCSNLIISKLDALIKTVDKLEKVINDKVLHI